MLTYENILDKNNDVKEIKVFQKVPGLSRTKRIGTIKKTTTVMSGPELVDAWQYFPKNYIHGGEIFLTISGVKNSLEAE